jgi:hypothetical protein
MTYTIEYKEHRLEASTKEGVVELYEELFEEQENTHTITWRPEEAATEPISSGFDDPIMGLNIGDER